MSNFKKIVVTVLLFGILSNCFNHWLLSYAYQFNKEYIASVLCTNKNNPHLHCEGKCFMDIKMKELEQKHKHDQENLQKLIETIAPVTSNTSHPVFELVLQSSIPDYLQEKPIKTATAIFHPPKTA